MRNLYNEINEMLKENNRELKDIKFISLENSDGIIEKVNIQRFLDKAKKNKLLCWLWTRRNQPKLENSR